jgi:hypothetical protein
MIWNLLNKLRARSTFGEAGYLGDIEEQGAQGVGGIGVQGLQTAPESGVTIAVRPTKENIRLVVRFEVFTAVTMNNGVFWVVTPCGSSQRTSVASCSLCCS